MEFKASYYRYIPTKVSIELNSIKIFGRIDNSFNLIYARYQRLILDDSDELAKNNLFYDKAKVSFNYIFGGSVEVVPLESKEDKEKSKKIQKRP